MDKMRPLFVAILASCAISWMVYSVVWIVVTVSSPTYRWMTVPSEWPDKITDYSFLQTLKPFGNDAMQEGRGAEGDIFLVQTNIIMLSMSDARQSDHRKEMRTIWARIANRVNTKRQKSAGAPTIESQYDLPVWHMFMCGFILPGGEQHRKKSILVTSPGRLQASGSYAKARSLYQEQLEHGDLLAVRAQYNNDELIIRLCLQLVTSLDFQYVIVLADSILPTGLLSVHSVAATRDMFTRLETTHAALSDGVFSPVNECLPSKAENKTTQCASMYLSREDAALPIVSSWSSLLKQSFNKSTFEIGRDMSLPNSLIDNLSDLNCTEGSMTLFAQITDESMKRIANLSQSNIKQLDDMLCFAAA